jgi:hypothetical protein
MFRSAIALIALSVSLCVQSLCAQSKFEYWPGTAYDPSVPGVRQVLGYDAGERVSSPEAIVRYLEALAAAKPDRVKLRDYGKTWENRRLVYAVIGSSANIKRLDEIKGGLAKLNDPRKTSDAEANKLIASLPAIVWLAYGVHGNEISSPDAGLMMAYHLAAARNDKTVDAFLSKVLVVIDPLQNPDGRNRFVHSYEVSEGLEPDANPLAAEHSEPWPGGRTNHYYFDMNRDWVAITQPETKGRIAAISEWHPQVVVDLHEMGTDATYYFAPPADPFNPNMTKWQRDYQTDIGKGNAKWFDRFGFSYFTRDTYDAFYPGYGDSWPVYTGAIAMTYENGSTRGLIVRRPSNDTVVTFRETVRRHFVTSIATCETSAEHHDELLKNYYDYAKSAIEQGKTGPVKEYILPRRGNTSQVDKLAQLLVEQGVEVSRATGPFTTEGKQYPAGTYVAPMAQPAGRRIKDLLDLNTVMDDKFLKAEEERRKRRLASQIYDVTAWSLPLQYNVEAIPNPSISAGSFSPVKAGDTAPGAVSGTGTVAWLVPWGTSAAARFMTAGLREDLRMYGSDKAFSQNGRTYPSGTLILPMKENAANAPEIVARIAKASGAEVVATDTTWVEDGPNFGSRDTPFIKKPSIALAWDLPTNGTSAGETRFVLERQYGYPVTVVRTQQLATADLSRFNVIILPDTAGSYTTTFGPAGIQRLKAWVADGGTIVGISGAVNFLADPAMGLLAIQQEDRYGATGAPGSGAGGGGRGGGGAAAAAAIATPAPAAAAPARVKGSILTAPAEFEKAIQPDTELPETLHGAIAKCRVDPEQWVNAGVPASVYTMVSGRAIFTPIKIDRGVNAVIFEAPDQVLASGYMWDEYRKQLAFKPFVVTARSGRGVVVGFTANPNYRAALDGLNLLFLNAVFRGPAHASGQ